MNTKYNYVFMNIAEDYLFPCFMPLKKYPFVRVYEHAFYSGGFIQKVFFYHWSKKVNDIIRLPLKRLWFKRMCKQNFENDKPICFVFYSGKYITEDSGLFRYIKSMNPENKCVVYYGDLISKKGWNIPEVKQQCDYIVTYDCGEASKYNIKFYNDLAYGAIMKTTTPESFEYDVYFLGFAKDRLEEIHDVYYALKEAGYKCYFIVCGVPKEKQIASSGIHYRAPISYRENIKNVIKSKCVLELIQAKSVAPTLRMREAQIYKRKFLTNNPALINQPFFDSENMSVFESVDKIDTDFLIRSIDATSFDTGNYDPYKRIEFLEELLC